MTSHAASDIQSLRSMVCDKITEGPYRLTGGTSYDSTELVVLGVVRTYDPDTLHRLGAALDAGVLAPNELRYLVKKGATEAQVREYAEFGPINLADIDEKWSIVRALHRYSLPETDRVDDFTEADERAKAVCRSLVTVLLAIYDGIAFDARHEIIVRLRSALGEAEPVIVHDGLLRLIRSHHERWDEIANFIRERGLVDLEALRMALDDTHRALGQGVL